MEKEKIINRDIFIVKISKAYTDNDYPIQYYFEFIEGEYSSFCPGIDRKLGNQPYFLYKD